MPKCATQIRFTRKTNMQHETRIPSQCPGSALRRKKTFFDWEQLPDILCQIVRLPIGVRHRSQQKRRFFSAATFHRLDLFGEQPTDQPAEPRWITCMNVPTIAISYLDAVYKIVPFLVKEAAWQEMHWKLHENGSACRRDRLRTCPRRCPEAATASGST
jgi:hypothetical protein